MENKTTWLVGLSAEKLVRALLIIGILAIFTMYIKSQNDLKHQTQKYEVEMIGRRVEERQRTDSFNLIMKNIQTDCNERYEQYLKQQLDKFENANKIVTSTVKKTEKIIKSIKNEK